MMAGMAPKPDHAQLLRLAQAEYERAEAERNAAQSARDAAIRKALRAKLTHAQIAEATGLTRGRIGQIATEAKRNG
jgi:hypothetical protein